MKIIFLAILSLHFLPGHTQKTIVVKFNCADSVRYITNLGQPTGCEFYFDNESPDIFYVEKFSPQDLSNLVYENDRSKLTRVKLVTPKYTPAVPDLIFAINKKNAVLFYYIVKDLQEEQKLFEPEK